MKKPFLAILTALLPFCSHSQNFFFSGSLGGFSSLAGGPTVGNGDYLSGGLTYINKNTVAYDNKSGSLGSGLKLDLEGGYMFNQFIGFATSLNIGAYSKACIYTVSNIKLRPPKSSNTDSLYYNVDYTTKANVPILLIPKLIIQAPISKNKLFGSFGVVLPLSTDFTLDVSQANLPGAGAVETTVYHFDYKTSFAAGLNAGFGFKKIVSERFNYFAQLEFTSLSVMVKEKTLSYITDDGEYINMSTQYPHPTHYYYSNNFTGSLQDDFHRTAYTVNYSNWGLKVGCQFNIVERRSHRSEVETNGKSGGGAYKRKGSIKF